MDRKSWLSKKLILISGKGGVGKSTLARAAAGLLAAQGRRTLLVHVLQIGDEAQRIERVEPNLWTVTLQASECFREYIILKLRLKTLYAPFLSSKVTQYLERAAPGVREITMLGKIWFERNNYDHVIVDMPSTGYALTMIHTPFNFAALFPGGPIYNDSRDMIKTLSDPELTAFVIATLPEEMPVQESVELAAEIAKVIPANRPSLIVNRVARVARAARELHERRFAGLSAAERASPLWRGLEYVVAREDRQRRILAQLPELWSPFGDSWTEIEDVAVAGDKPLAQAIASRLEPSP